MCQKGIEKRKQRIQIVERWAARPLGKREVFLLGENQRIENCEIGASSIAFKSSQRLDIGPRINSECSQCRSQSDRSLGQLFFFFCDGMFARCAQQYIACICHLCSNYRSDNADCGIGIVGCPVLLPSQEYIASDRPFHSCLESPVFRETTDAHAILGTERKKSGAEGHIAQTYD
jgi:hypothetical protein